MSNQSWYISVEPKVQGSWNLHNSIKGKDSTLGFFLMTSSVAGSVGTATKSNYTAADSFTDYCAKYRRKSMGLGALSEVSYLHKNPEIEAVLLRKGTTLIKKDELLSIIDITLSRPHGLEPSEAHVLTGLETQGMNKAPPHGLRRHNPHAQRPARLHPCLLPRRRGRPPLQEDRLRSAARACGDADAVLDTLTGIVVARLANLILVPAGKIDREMPLMDVPFLFLLGDVVTPRALGKMVLGDMLAAGRFTIDG